MLINRAEYEAMSATEENMWWYKALHSKVLASLKATKTKAQILDAGCGTGGLIQKLNHVGFSNVNGFDYSADAVELAQEKKLLVVQGSILEPITILNNDVVISNDVLCQFSEEDIIIALKGLTAACKEGGILIMNNQAFNAFKGIHDLAVGAKIRFTLAYFQRLISKHNLPLEIVEHHYWSYLLSPIILSVRLWQRLQLSLNMVDLHTIHSDVAMPPKWLNTLFFSLCRLEDALPFRLPFGSSLFMVLRKTK